jgi:hypothetical protein
MEGFFMSKRKSNGAAVGSSDVTSAGVPWAKVPDFALADIEWMDGRHGSAKAALPSIDQTPIPAVLFILPFFLICTRIVHADQRP